MLAVLHNAWASYAPHVGVQRHLPAEQSLPVVFPRGWLLADKIAVHESNELFVVQRYELVGAPVEDAALLGKELSAPTVNSIVPPRSDRRAGQREVLIADTWRSSRVELQNDTSSGVMTVASRSGT